MPGETLFRGGQCHGSHRNAGAAPASLPSLSTLSLALDDPPTRPQVQAILDQFNALVNQLTRV